MIVTPTDPPQFDPQGDNPWEVKLRRAQTHRAQFDSQVADFLSTDPITIERIESPDSTDVEHRPTLHRLPPGELSTTLGDFLHNLSSALDSVAFALARHSKGSDLTDDEEQATSFPICESPDRLDRFFGQKPRPNKWEKLRGTLYAEPARKAFIVAQPYRWIMVGTGIAEAERTKRYAQEYEWSSLQRMRALHNLDKHRRLTLFGFRTDIFYFTSNEGADISMRSGAATEVGASVILSGEDAKDSHFVHDFALALTDDPPHKALGLNDHHPEECRSLLDSFTRHTTDAVIQVLQTYAWNLDQPQNGP